MRLSNLLILVCLALLATAITGCTGLTPGKTEWVQPQSDTAYAGKVYLLRGLIGVFSTGMDSLSAQLNAKGIKSHVFQDDQRWTLASAITEKYKGAKNPEPLVLIGHSYGADDVVRVARELDKENIPVDLLITFDCTIPPDVPKNVKTCYNYFQSQPTDFIPLFRGIALKKDPDAKGNVVNIDLRKDRKDLLESGTNHINIDKNQKLHDAVIANVLTVCIPRAQWTARPKPPAPPGAYVGAPSTKPAPVPPTKQAATATPSRGL